MLHFIIGTAGTGKTALLLEKMRISAQKSEKVIYLVPEQFSFEAEKMLYRQGPQLALNMEVLSFTRLCNSIFRTCGGLAGTALTQTEKYLLMSVAVEQLREKLVCYNKSCANTAFLQTLVQTCGEFKTAGVSCEALAAFAQDCAPSPLKDKLRELSLLYTAYQGLIVRGYSDPDDDLIRACAVLENNDFFKDTCVFIDGFTTFMAAEFEMLSHVVAQAKEVYVSATADGIYDYQHEMGVFSPAKAMMARLTGYAQNCGVTVDTPLLLTHQHRFAAPELAHVASFFMQPVPQAYAGEITGALTVQPWPDRYSEVAAAAAEITRVVREENCRYNEIAVIARDPAPYAQAIESAFLRYEIPLFMSVAEDIENKPLIACVMAALAAVRSGLDSAAVLQLAKSPLLGLDLQAVSELENYCYCWSVRASLWASDFTNSPRGLSGAMSDEDIALLWRINTTRRAVITPLLQLREALKNADGKAFATAIFAFLQQLSCAERLEQYAGQLDPAEQNAFLDESAQLWDVLMEILDIFATVLGGYKLPQARFFELFRLAVNAAEVASLPRTLDQVLIGAADRIRPTQMRCVFILGANEEVFPQKIAVSGVFNDAERRQMIEAGLQISAPALKKSVLENYFAYFALTLPSERLWVGYCCGDLQGRQLQPSAIVRELAGLFPELPAQKPDMLAGAYTQKSAFELYARHYREDSALAATMEDFFTRACPDTIQKMRRAYAKPPHLLREPAVARGLFGQFMRLSPTRIERYHKCAFAYFASEGLHLRTRGKAEFSPIQSGSVIHHVLQVIVQKRGGKALLTMPEELLTAEIGEIIQAYLAGLVEDVDALPTRLRFLFQRLPASILRLLRRLGAEFAQSGYDPVAFELPINLQEGVEPLRLRTPDGVTVIVEGKVDRVDIMNKNGKRYVRVIDYKSGKKSFALHDVLYGLNMQMLLYLFTIQENAVGDIGGAIPAGVLYLPASENFTTATRDTDEASVQKSRERALCMSGLLLDDEESLRGMEHDLAGVFIPAKVKLNGKLDTQCLANLAQLGMLARKVKEQIKQMAAALGEGAIAACPVEENGIQACAYCDYRAVCGYERGDATRQIAKLNKDAFFKMLAEEEPDATRMD